MHGWRISPQSMHYVRGNSKEEDLMGSYFVKVFPWTWGLGSGQSRMRVERSWTGDGSGNRYQSSPAAGVELVISEEGGALSCLEEAHITKCPVALLTALP